MCVYVLMCESSNEFDRTYCCVALPSTQTPIDVDDCSFVRIYGCEWVSERACVYVWHEKDLNKTKLRFIVQFLHIYSLSLSAFCLFTRFLSRHPQHLHAMFIFTPNGRPTIITERGKDLHSLRKCKRNRMKMQLIFYWIIFFCLHQFRFFHFGFFCE